MVKRAETHPPPPVRTAPFPDWFNVAHDAEVTNGRGEVVGWVKGDRGPYRDAPPSEVDLLRAEVRELQKNVDRLMYPRPPELVNAPASEFMHPDNPLPAALVFILILAVGLWAAL